ncbi:E3 ubiquitin-protein ligase RNF19B [Platysternon megacephalum]|uniref:E3 ubiquitin-protein ligase RNF19B n=1 Tax=Platysternon megacephalum TaxID=55544 RepID=A0A4D9ESN4_9SAUR|nr:E3 ubiquitin-protein ligase RNF19B [Platysternon megacephalum]
MSPRCLFTLVFAPGASSAMVNDPLTQCHSHDLACFGSEWMPTKGSPDERKNEVMSALRITGTDFPRKFSQEQFVKGEPVRPDGRSIVRAQACPQESLVLHCYRLTCQLCRGRTWAELYPFKTHTDNSIHCFV